MGELDGQGVIVESTEEVPRVRQPELYWNPGPGYQIFTILDNLLRGE
jgi:hypothetical protein